MFHLFLTEHYRSRKKNPQKLTQLSLKSHPRHLVGKRTAQKDIIKDITSDSQVDSYFPYRWSPASLTAIGILRLVSFFGLKVVIITNLGQRQKSA